MAWCESKKLNPNSFQNHYVPYMPPVSYDEIERSFFALGFDSAIARFELVASKHWTSIDRSAIERSLVSYRDSFSRAFLFVKLKINLSVASANPAFAVQLDSKN